MSKTINNINKSLKDLGLTEEQVIELIKNNISGDISQLNTSNKNSLVDAINEVFQSGNSAKQELVAALVAKGLNATTNMTFSQLIDSVETNLAKPAGTAVAANVLSGKTFMNSSGTLQTGAMLTIDSNMVGWGGNSNNHWMTGEVQVTDASGIGNPCVYFAVPRNHCTNIDFVMASTPDLRPENIISGKNILGVWGSATTSPTSMHGTWCYTGMLYNRGEYSTSITHNKGNTNYSIVISSYGNMYDSSTGYNYNGSHAFINGSTTTQTLTFGNTIATYTIRVTKSTNTLNLYFTTTGGYAVNVNVFVGIL